MVLPAPIVAEVGYLLGTRAGAEVEANFLLASSEGDFVPVQLTTADYARMAELVKQYADLPLGTSDASAIALAKRLDVDEVTTLDHRHFTVVRPRHVQAFTLLPKPLHPHSPAAPDMKPRTRTAVAGQGTLSRLDAMLAAVVTIRRRGEGDSHWL